MCTYDDANVGSMHAGLLVGRCLGCPYRAAVYHHALCAKNSIVLHVYHVLLSLMDDVCPDALKFLFTLMQVSIRVNPFNYLGKAFIDLSVIFQ